MGDIQGHGIRIIAPSPQVLVGLVYASSFCSCQFCSHPHWEYSFLRTCQFRGILAVRRPVCRCSALYPETILARTTPGACIANIGFDLPNGKPLITALGFCTANTLEAFPGAGQVFGKQVTGGIPAGQASIPSPMNFAKLSLCSHWESCARPVPRA